MDSGVDKSESDNEAYDYLARSIGERPKRNHQVVDKAKQGKRLCDHCSWRPPDSNILHAHHIIPVSCGGLDAIENIIILCPNCHAIAHFVCYRSSLRRHYTGPATALDLRLWMAAAKHPSRLKQLREAHMMAHVTPILAAMRA